MSSNHRMRWIQSIGLIFFLGLSLLSFSLVQNIAQSRSQEVFQGLVDQSLISLEQRFEDYNRILDGVAGLVMASNEVTSEDMSNYVKALNLDDGKFELDAIGLTAEPQAEIDLRGILFPFSDGVSPFSVAPSKQQSNQHLVKYIEPVVGREMFLGLDFASNPDLLDVVQKARDTGQTLASGYLPGFVPQLGPSRSLLLKPIYKSSQNGHPMKPHQDEFLGFAFAVLSVEGAFKGLTSAQGKLIEIHAALDTAPAIDKLENISGTAGNVPDFSLRKSIDEFGKTFSLVLDSTPHFDSIQPFRVKWFVLALGFLITALITTIFRVLMKKNSTISAAVVQKTQDLETQDKEKRSILENAMLAIISVSKSGRILHANEAALRLLLPLNGQMSLTDKLLSEVLPEFNQQGADGWSKIHMISKAENTEPSVIEVEKNTWLTADGEERTTLLMRDITVTERHAQEIFEAEQRWNLALMSAQIGVFDIELGRDTSVVSDTWLENMQMEAYPEGNNPYREQIVRMHPDDLVHFKNAEAACFEGHTDRAVVRFRINGVNNDWRWIKSDAVVVDRAPDGTPLRMLGVQMDVTESFELERMKRDFVATVSHELRTPLTSIKGAIGLLQAQLQADKLNGPDRLIQIASSNCDRLASLVNDILDMEKMKSGNMNHDLKTVRLSEILNDASQQIETYAVQWNVGLEVVKPRADDEILTDKKRVIQVLTNLLSNACKFADSNSKVGLTAEVLPTHVKISVSNTGPGIPEEFRSRIFQPFSQADSTDSRQRGGTGLGLSISRSLIEAMGGTIGFESVPDQKTVFWFTCPLAAAPEIACVA